MTDYRRNRVPGGTYFFPVNLQDRRSDLLVRHIDRLREALTRARAKTPFWVVLPEHMHCLWTLPEGDTDFSTRRQAIKGIFSRRIALGEDRSASRVSKGERRLVATFLGTQIRDDGDYALHMDYIHFNPAKHGLVADAADWPYSSFHRCVANGLYPAGWDRATTERP